MIRDILCGQIPLVLRQEIYATAAILGGLVYWLCAAQFNQETIGTFACIIIVSSLRILAIEKHWRVPKVG